MPHPGSNNSNYPTEIAEVETPVRIEQYGIVQDTGGAGKYRGAMSQVREVRCLATEATLQLRSDKRLFPPYSLQGGKPGTPSWNVLNPGDRQVVLPAMGVAQMKRGDVIHHVMAGGGGWGDPLERDPELVRDDVFNEKLSVEYARREYGVAVDPDEFVVVGTGGRLVATPLNDGNLTIETAAGVEVEAHPPEENFNLPLITDFVAAIRDNRSPLVDGDEGRATNEVIERAYALGLTADDG